MAADLTTVNASTDLPVLRRDADGVTTLQLNRPAQANLLSEAMLGALQAEFDALADDARLRCVVLAAEGRAFSGGHDLRALRAQPDHARHSTLFSRCSRLMLSIRALPVPVIARVQGTASAAGCQLVAACDLAVAADTACFAVSEIDVGLFCATPAVALSRAIAPKRAFDMLVSGRFIDAATALDWGLINGMVSADALDAAMASRVAAIVAKAPAAVRHGKAMFYRQREMLLDDAYLYAADVMAVNLMEEETAGQIDAFLDRSGRGGERGR
ncbi:enoyl-CoA hydratase [Burkholderia plantarii]|nr:enoyl-CoA hydratase [Burkholderia plantarii]